MKRQHKLFGNIEFIGELYTCFLLRGDTAKSIFEHLLHPDCYLDDTVEAAIKFIEKIGPTIEEKLGDNKSGGGDGARRKISKEDYAVWNMLHKNASLSVNNRESMLEEVAAKIEFDLEIVGSSAIEDRL